MSATTLDGVMLTGNHAARPAATAVAGGTLYSCSTHSLIYQSNTSAWSTWATLGTSTTADHDHTTTAGDGGDLDGGRIGNFLEFAEAAAPSTPASGLARVYVKSDGRVYNMDDAGTEYGPFDVAGGGGALVGERKPWDVAGTYPLSADGSEFEFADLTAFDAVWTRRNVATTDVFNPPGSQTEVLFGAQGDAIYKSATFANDMWVVMEATDGVLSGENMFGIAILNSSGTGVACVTYSGGIYNIAMTAWDYASLLNNANPSGPDYLQITNGQHSWWGLERISGTDYRGAVSIDGTSWLTRPAANTPTAFTPAYIAVVRAFSGGNLWRRIHRVNTYTVAFP